MTITIDVRHHQAITPRKVEVSNVRTVDNVFAPGNE